MVNKATHEPYKIELFMPVIKEASGKYIAVLSDNSCDRDDERVSKDCIEKMAKDNGYLVALCDHYNSVFMQVAEWTNKRVKVIDGHTALIAEPKFYKSNPRAQIIQGMLDEGAKIGISIGAIVKEYDEIDGKRLYTDLELLEASFVAIPANKHGMAMAIAKSYNKKNEVHTMDKEYTQKDVDSAVEKKVEETKAEFTKQLEDNKAEVTKLKKELEDSGKKVEDSEKSLEKSKEELDESTTKLKDTKDALEKAEKTALEKQKFADQGGEGKDKLSDADIDKALEKGHLPIMRG